MYLAVQRFYVYMGHADKSKIAFDDNNVADNLYNDRMAEEQMKYNKTITLLWKAIKILVFFSFIWTAIIMFNLKDVNAGIQIIFAASFFLILTRIDSINKRLNELEERFE